MIEHIMERIARSLNKDPATVKQLNFYKEGQVLYFVLNFILTFKTCYVSLLLHLHTPLELSLLWN
jgi:xanthine dehydrogenase molybdopterin-binding subunit B